MFGDALVVEAKRDPRVIGITAAMAGGTGLTALEKECPEQYYDVGIAEQDAVLFAAGLAIQGAKPVCAIYSTFLQRAYDQLVHDVCLQKLNVVFAMDRAGLVGDDGPTHHGAFDVSYFRSLPNVVVMAPRDEAMLCHMLRTALAYDDGPIAFRYPRGTAEGVPLPDRAREIPIGTGEVLKEGERVALLGYGYGVRVALDAAALLAEHDLTVTVADARFAKPLDEALIERLAAEHELAGDDRGERARRRLRLRGARARRGRLRRGAGASARGCSGSASPTATSPTASRRSCARRSGSPARRSPSGSRRRSARGNRGRPLARFATCVQCDRSHTRIAHMFVAWFTMSTRAIPLSIHGALEMIAAPAIMVAPFLLGFGAAATVITVALGALLLGLALQVEGPQRSVPLSAHAGFDYALALAAPLAGLAIGLIAGEWAAGVFLVGIGAALVALTASTRFTRAPRRLSTADLLPQTKKHISLLPVPETPRKVRGVSLSRLSCGFLAFGEEVGGADFRGAPVGAPVRLSRCTR